MTSVFVFGLTGRMGQELKELLSNSASFKLVGGYGKENKQLDIVEDIDIVIDFSLPETQKDLISFCKKKNCSLVSGTTGFDSEQKKALKMLSQHRPVFWSANMSFGVYLMSQLIEKLSSQKAKFEYQITDIHHIHKKDSPSGTALLLESHVDPTAKLLPTESLRRGDVLGIHNFKATSNYETIEIIHTATNRKLFADGALQIAQWLCNQPPGYYSMADFFKNS